MRRCLGRIARGHGQYWPDEALLNELYQSIAIRGESRKLFGLRRIGKSSHIAAFEDRLAPSEEVCVIYIDAQQIVRFDTFLELLCKGIKKNKHWIRRAKNNPQVRAALDMLLSSDLVKLKQPTEKSDPNHRQSFADALRFQELWSGRLDIVLRSDVPIVLIIEELPFMIRNMLQNGHSVSDITTMLATLRHWRNECGVRMLLSGSLGLRQIERDHDVAIADHMGDILPVFVNPLARDNAIAMINRLAQGERIDGWNQSVSETIVDTVAETWPVFLQHGFNAVANTSERGSDAVRELVKASNAVPLDETFYKQFTTRLGRYGDDEKPSRLILSIIKSGNDQPVSFAAIDAALVAHPERRDDVMEALREDDFIRFDTASQTAWLASKLVPVWIAARPWGK